jgi:hypothetical protein
MLRSTPIPHHVPPEDDAERDGRTGDQILRSVLSYLGWRAGDGWRNINRRSQRWSSLRMDYLAAYFVVSTVRCAPERAWSELPPPRPVVSAVPASGKRGAA